MGHSAIGNRPMVPNARMWHGHSPTHYNASQTFPAAPPAVVMNSVRSAKSYYAAAFILGALIALLVAAPVHSAEKNHPDRARLILLAPGVSIVEAQPAAPDVAGDEVFLEIETMPGDADQIYGALQ